ncbi:MAG: uncharacterized protein A8A55_1907 [Amphiamblys sp. WSBS2006]|nr:MAG: uncharacterized protein A8A55_1907 [Amphiamblys sp. WSBS2006]
MDSFSIPIKILETRRAGNAWRVLSGERNRFSVLGSVVFVEARRGTTVFEVDDGSALLRCVIAGKSSVFKRGLCVCVTGRISMQRVYQMDVFSVCVVTDPEEEMFWWTRLIEIYHALELVSSKEKQQVGV